MVRRGADPHAIWAALIWLRWPRTGNRHLGSQVKSHENVSSAANPWIEAQLSRANWSVPHLSPRLTGTFQDFAEWLLLPGMSLSLQAHLLSRSVTFARKHRLRAEQMARCCPEIEKRVKRTVATLSPQDGLKMARLRGRCQLPFWSKLALANYRKQGEPLIRLSKAFLCSERCIQYVLSHTNFAQADRMLSSVQLCPPKQFTRQTAARRLAPINPATKRPYQT